MVPADGFSEDTWSKLSSSEDASVNFIRKTVDGGFIECRFVQRIDPYCIVYLSSHSGCKESCRFCHLTASGQVMMEPVDVDGYLAQAEIVLQHYDELKKTCSKVNFNFMARGEPLANPYLWNHWPEIRAGLMEAAAKRNLKPQFNISTIMPASSAQIDLIEAFPRSDASDVMLYYSLYSLKPSFRRRWLPKAQDPLIALERLAAWQKETGGRLALHWALIKGENDSVAEAFDIGETVRDFGIRAKFNSVRYNSFSVAHGEESDDAARSAYFETLSKLLGDADSREVPRVGFDVKASCGMFVGGRLPKLVV